MATELEESQERLATLEGDIIANREAREALREDGKALRDQYIAEEKVRDQLLNTPPAEGDE